jgi:hypothetical protein
VSKQHCHSKRKTITNALSRLGRQAHGKEVVALLADYGIDVSEDLVRSVRIASMKKSDALKTKQARIDQMCRRRRMPTVRKVPQQRTYRR